MERLENMKGYIFDLDGTLLDSMWLWKQIDIDFLSDRGLSMPDDYTDAISPLCFNDAAIYTKERFNLKESIEEITNEWRNRAKYAYEHEIKLKPYVKEYLDYLKAKGSKLAVATSLEPKLFELVLKNNKIYEYFDAFTYVEEVEKGKGHPDIYLETARRINLKPSECAVFEDIYAGVKGAKKGGFLTVAVFDEFSNSQKELIEETSDIYLDDFSFAK